MYWGSCLCWRLQAGMKLNRKIRKHNLVKTLTSPLLKKSLLCLLPPESVTDPGSLARKPGLGTGAGFTMRGLRGYY